VRAGRVQGVEKDAVEADGGDYVDEGFGIVLGLSMGAGVPGVVGEDGFDATLVDAVYDVFEALLAAGELSVVVELVTGIDADSGVGLPEGEGIEAAEVAIHGVEPGLYFELVMLWVVEFAVEDHYFAEGEAGSHPGEGRVLIGGGVVGSSGVVTPGF
jgi:hypothetical protein